MNRNEDRLRPGAPRCRRRTERWPSRPPEGHGPRGAAADDDPRAGRGPSETPPGDASKDETLKKSNRIGDPFQRAFLFIDLFIKDIIIFLNHSSYDSLNIILYVDF